MIGWIASFNILGAAIGGFITTIRIGRNSLRGLATIGLIMLVVFDLISIFCTTEFSLLSVRLLSGIGGGIVYAAALAAFSGLKDATKAFATYIVVYCFFGGIILITMPWLLSLYGIKSGFLILASVALICFFFLPSLDRFGGSNKKKEIISLNYLVKNKNVLAGLLSYFLVQLAGGTMWAYAERIGKEAMLSIEFIGLILGISVVFALIGGLLVMRVKKEWGIVKPLSIGILVMVVGTAFLFLSEYKTLFIMANIVTGIAWSFVIPFYQQMQAQFDDAGRVVSMGTIVNMGGRSAGPAIAALTLGSSAYYNALWISIVALLLSMILAIPAIKGLKA